MRRREFLAGLGSAAARPVVARAQQGDRVRRIGIIVPGAADDPETQARVGAFLQELAQLGWAIGRNLQIDMHWAGPNPADIGRHAAQVAAFGPDVILAHGASTVRPLLQGTRTVPIVFPAAVDPVGEGFVDSLARPGGNADVSAAARSSRAVRFRHGEVVCAGLSGCYVGYPTSGERWLCTITDFVASDAWLRHQVVCVECVRRHGDVRRVSDPGICNGPKTN
jgi:hypothetical protein